ncbi:hypothetical protein TNCV_4548691 [Trichonephila clavipes]|nr:hypothetical protein TNCV_4548691 [Trichonephila clavipes]
MEKLICSGVRKEDNGNLKTENGQCRMHYATTYFALMEDIEFRENLTKLQIHLTLLTLKHQISGPVFFSSTICTVYENAWNKPWPALEGENVFKDNHREKITDFDQLFPGFQKCDEEDVETPGWHAMQKTVDFKC